MDESHGIYVRHENMEWFQLCHHLFLDFFDKMWKRLKLKIKIDKIELI